MILIHTLFKLEPKRNAQNDSPKGKTWSVLVIIWRHNNPASAALVEFFEVVIHVSFLPVTTSYRNPYTCTRRVVLKDGKTSDKNLQLALQHCCKTSWKAMSSVTPTNQLVLHKAVCCGLQKLLLKVDYFNSDLKELLRRRRQLQKTIG